MPTVLPADSGLFGVTGSPTFQSKSVSTKFDKKEASNNEGTLCAWAFYGKMADHSIELLGTDALTYTLGVTAVAPAGVAAAVAGTIFVVDELVLNYVNDDFTKSSIKVSEYVIEN